uniref:helix-turn-helix domain-containing protein n=1 Tax=Segatella hominis TaxID=2518605 RepID=UPI0040288467
MSPSHWSLAQQARNGGVTQAQLAELLKVNQAFISKIETCERRLDIIELHHICQVLGISFVDFIQEVDRDILCKRKEESYITIKDLKKIRYGKN